MYLFQTSKKTINDVFTSKSHAFSKEPSEWEENELVLIRETKQQDDIVGIASIKSIKKSSKEEMPDDWYEMGWKYLIKFKEIVKLKKPFNIRKVLVRPDKNYIITQTYSILTRKDEEKILNYLKQNEEAELERITESISQSNFSIPVPTGKRGEDLLHVLDNDWDIDKVKKLNKESRGKSPKKRQEVSWIIERNRGIIQELKKRHSKKCQICETNHFKQKNGGPYCEVHHVDFLAEGGSQESINCLVVCATCHSKLHYADVDVKLRNDDEYEIMINKTIYPNVKRNIIR